MSSKTPTHPQGWRFKGAASGYCVWHAGKNDYRVTAPGGFVEVAQGAQFGIAFSKAMRKADADKALTAYYQDRANGSHAAKAP